MGWGWEALELELVHWRASHPSPASRASSFAPRISPQPSDAFQPSIKNYTTGRLAVLQN